MGWASLPLTMPKSLGPVGCRRPWPINMVIPLEEAEKRGKTRHALSAWWMAASSSDFMVYYAAVLSPTLQVIVDERSSA